MSHRETWSTRIQGWINEGMSLGLEPMEIRSKVEDRLAIIANDKKAVARLESIRRPVGPDEARKLLAGITTKREDRAGYTPRLVKAVKYALYQRYRMLTADEKGLARNLWRSPIMAPGGSPDAKTVRTMARDAGIPV